jgi:hypothetical protein
MSDNLQRNPPVGVDWTGNNSAQPAQAGLVTLFIGVPDDARVRRNTITGQIEIDDITVSDLVNLRDSIDQQITELNKKAGWEPL